MESASSVGSVGVVHDPLRRKRGGQGYNKNKFELRRAGGELWPGACSDIAKEKLNSGLDKELLYCTGTGRCPTRLPSFSCPPASSAYASSSIVQSIL